MVHWSSILPPLQSGQKLLSCHSVCVGAEWTRMNQIYVGVLPVVVSYGHTYCVRDKRNHPRRWGDSTREWPWLSFPLHHPTFWPTEASVNPQTLVLTLHEGQCSYLRLASYLLHVSIQWFMLIHLPALSLKTHIQGFKLGSVHHVSSHQLQISPPRIWSSYT